MAESQRWWSKETIALVTGGNKGIGYEIVRSLAKQKVTTILTARDESRGLEAVESLKQQDPSLNLHFRKLDVASSESVKAFSERIKSEFGGIDILVNNAGVARFPNQDQLSKLEVAKAVFNTNYYGVQRVTDRLIPLLKPAEQGARIINISSGTSRLDCLRNEELRRRLTDIQNLSIEELNKIVEGYMDDVKNDRVVEKGWPGFFGNYDYCASKILLNAYARVVARDLEAWPHKIFINCMCPGLSTGHSAEVGADTAVWLALLPAKDCVSGQFFTRRTSVGFVTLPFYMNDIFTFSLEECEAEAKKIEDSPLLEHVKQQQLNMYNSKKSV